MPIIEVLIFRGTGGVLNQAHPYHDEAALVRAGHVGVLGVIDDKTIGFHPTPAAVALAGGERQILEALSNYQAQPGCLQDDTHHFARAAELRGETDGRTTVYIYAVEITQSTLAAIRRWYNDQREAPYNFPDRVGGFQDDQSNCALFWKRFGIPLPVTTGIIRELTNEMSEQGYEVWQPDAS